MKREYFQQEEPRLGNSYLEDEDLIDALKKILPKEYLKEIESDFISFAERLKPNGLIYQWAKSCENNPPTLTHYNAWGRRIDKINLDQGWINIQRMAAEEGLVAIGYERKYGEYSRFYQYLKLYLFSSNGSVGDCPLAMADGVARVLELNLHQVDPKFQDEIKDTLGHITSRDPDYFWSSGQWMTEKTGGSDVGGSETLAIPNKDGTYNLYGYKYFTSSTTSKIALTLAKVSNSLNEKKKITVLYHFSS